MEINYKILGNFMAWNGLEQSLKWNKAAWPLRASSGLSYFLILFSFCFGKNKVKEREFLNCWNCYMNIVKPINHWLYHWNIFWVKATLFGQCQQRTSQLIIWHKIVIWPFLRNFWLVENVQSGHCVRNIPITILKL